MEIYRRRSIETSTLSLFFLFLLLLLLDLCQIPSTIVCRFCRLHPSIFPQRLLLMLQKQLKLMLLLLLLLLLLGGRFSSLFFRSRKWERKRKREMRGRGKAPSVKGDPLAETLRNRRNCRRSCDICGMFCRVQRE